MPDFFFLTSLGKSAKYDSVTYALDGQTATTRYAPVATARLLKLSGATALVLVTEEVRNSPALNDFIDELKAAGLTCELIIISTVDDAADLDKLLAQLAKRIPENSRLTLDITLGLRHLPFYYFAIIAFLNGLRNVALQGVYYGAHELPQGGHAPILALGHLFGLVEWFQALRTFRDAGDAAAIGRALKKDVGQLFRQRIAAQDLSKVKDGALGLAEAAGLGLPLEAGIAAAQLTHNVEHLNASPSAPAAYLAAEAMRSEVASWILLEQLKAAVTLEQKELQRQIAFTRWRLDHGDMGGALRLIRELIVNIVLLATGDSARWLHRPVRLAAEHYLHALSSRAQAGLLSSTEQSELAGAWNSATQLRNRVAHVGMCPEDAQTSQDKIQGLLTTCSELAHCSFAPFTPRGGALLVSPLGKSPGVLFSALKTTNPARVIIVTSNEAAEKLDEIKREAGYARVEFEICTLIDPHAGFTEISVANSKLDRLLIDAAEVIVNITGGTTALQWAVERIAERADRLGASVRHIALVDRRPFADQQSNPYVVGERIDLKSTEPHADAD